MCYGDGKSLLQEEVIVHTETEPCGGTSALARQDYDSPEGIKHALTKGIAGLIELVGMRRRAREQRQEQLNRFVLLGGRLWLDQAGNISRVCARDEDVLRSTAGFPDVLPEEEFWDKLRELRSEPGLSITRATLPPINLVCERCRGGWTVDNVLDVHPIQEDYRNESLSEFAGRSFGQVLPFYTGEKVDENCEYGIVHSSLLRKERDLNGFDGETLVGSDFKISENSTLHYLRLTYYHRECHKYVLADEHRKQFDEIFRKAGYIGFRLLAIPNQYVGNYPWFRVQTDFGEIKIGWRRRVISISWDTQVDDEGLFEQESETKGIGSIHAHGVEKTIEYLRMLRSFWLKHGTGK